MNQKSSLKDIETMVEKKRAPGWPQRRNRSGFKAQRRSENEKSQADRRHQNRSKIGVEQAMRLGVEIFTILVAF